MSFHCTIVTPEAQTFDSEVTQVILPAHDGQLGVLTNRAPLLVKLGIGPLQIDLPGNKSLYFAVDGGVAQMRANKLTLLTSSAIPSTALDPTKAAAELAAAEALPPTDKSKLAAVRRAQTKIALAGK
jgi:F-type H+-transporting ATPase subunit epsilon